ncbi:hypothetical protein HAZT_HAZT008454 [Hyalella azteca]|uniref:Uncharacterized protein n=1 Tax=Hyalella azteca TaxID=294128 RepID=A0A6A0HC47_HYAAZ|nr:hypothetical protein HAZT_HAZT008454 [Hyalella azteca]
MRSKLSTVVIAWLVVAVCALEKQTAGVGKTPTSVGGGSVCAMSSRMHSARNSAAAAAAAHGAASANSAKVGGAAAVLGGPRPPSATSGVHDQRAKTILKEAVDAVVNSFAKHTQGYGRGE